MAIVPRREGGVDWRHRAACLQEDTELFFPIGTTGPAEAQIEDAKAVSRACEVSVTCLDLALATGEDSGVWGGMSEDERREVLLARPSSVERRGEQASLTAVAV